MRRTLRAAPRPPGLRRGARPRSRRARERSRRRRGTAGARHRAAPGHGEESAGTSAWRRRPLPRRTGEAPVEIFRRCGGYGEPCAVTQEAVDLVGEHELLDEIHGFLRHGTWLAVAAA